MSRAPLTWVVALGAAVLLTAPPARGQAAGKDDARRFFNAGQKAFQAGRYVEAAKAFEEAFRLKPHPAPLINAGDAWEKAGESAHAARIYQRVLKLEQSGEQDKADATDRLAKLSPKLGILELSGDSSARVRVDEEEFQGGERVYVVPGEHTVALLDVEGAKPKTVDVAAGTSRTVTFASLMPTAEKPGGTGDEPPDTGGGAPEPDKPAQKKGGIRAGTWLVLGLTVVAAGGAVYFGLQVNDAEKKYNDDPNQDDFDRFNQNKLLTNVSLGVAVVGATVGTILLISDSKRKVPADKAGSSRPVRLPVDVAATPGGGMLVGRGVF